jgi:hypothetical protein
MAVFNRLGSNLASKSIGPRLTDVQIRKKSKQGINGSLTLHNYAKAL